MTTQTPLRDQYEKIDWYVANTHGNAEVMAAGHLKLQGFSVYLPMYKKLRSHARRKEWVARPLFPRYLFVGVGEKNRCWQAIRSTVGISHLVCFNGEPSHVDSEILTCLRAQEDDSGMIKLSGGSGFKKGERVQIVTGALAERSGLFDSIDDKMRVTVLLDLLGRRLKIRIPVETVQACT